MNGSLAAMTAAEVRPVPGREGVEVLAFNSAILGQRTEAMVWLPGPDVLKPWPVTYHLHGTVGTTFPRPVERWAERRWEQGLPLHPQLARSRRTPITPDSMGFAESRRRHRFLAVAPDAGDRAWCVACNWVNGRNKGVPAERHLLDELIPLVQEVYETRTDRGGRAVIGHSMGGGGAMIQAFRHPDLFTFAGSSSGTLTVLDDWVSRTGLRWLFYNRTQGFRPIPLDRISYQNNNLVDLAPNVRDVDIELVAVIGDGEVHEDTAEDTYDGSVDFFAGDEAQRAEQTTMEVFQRRNNDLVVPRLLQAGVKLDYITREGIHQIGPSTFRRHFLDRLHGRFSHRAADPPRFSYRSADDSFAVFGYRASVTRTKPGFIDLVNAEADGTSVTLIGEGRVELTMPLAPEAGAVHVRQPGLPNRLKEGLRVADGRRVLIELDPARSRIGGPGTIRPAEADVATIEAVHAG